MFHPVRAKKKLGQHFLNDISIAQNIVNALLDVPHPKTIIEIGPGTGVLTQFFSKTENINFYAYDVDSESVEFLHKLYPQLKDNIFLRDILREDLQALTHEPFAIVGNFPYNISSQILFKLLENRDQSPLLVGMFQKEVAERVAAKTRTKARGILSVLCQAFYDVEYLFTVNEDVFIPPPKVKSGVIRLTRKENFKLDCDEVKFFSTVKVCFNQRRKTLRNSSKTLGFSTDTTANPIFNKRAEELTVDEFVWLTNQLTIT